MREEEFLEAPGLLGLSDLGLEILVKERHREITQLDQRHLNTRLTRSFRGNSN
jgi:hypothetical protein